MSKGQKITHIEVSESHNQLHDERHWRVGWKAWLSMETRTKIRLEGGSPKQYTQPYLFFDSLPDATEYSQYLWKHENNWRKELDHTYRNTYSLLDAESEGWPKLQGSPEKLQP